MKQNLSTWEAACIITGYGIGGGVMSLPYLAAKNGIFIAFLLMTAAFAASYVLHLMLADLALKTPGGNQVIACFSRFLFRGKWEKPLTFTFFGLMLIVIWANLAGYNTGAEEILTGIFHIPSIAAKILFYACAAVVVLFGLKAVGISESAAIIVIFGFVAVLAAASFLRPGHPVTLFQLDGKAGLAFFGMGMFSLSAFFSVPQAAIGLNGDTGKIRKAIFLGFLNNYIIILVVCVCTLYASEKVTPMAMVGWSQGIGVWAQIVGSLFILLAILTTYWSLSLALAEMVKETTGLGYKICWMAATIPAFMLSLLHHAGFMELLRLAGGLISIVIAVMAVPAFIHARDEVKGSLLRKNGTIVCGVIIAAYILMGIGSIVPIS